MGAKPPGLGDNIQGGSGGLSPVLGYSEQGGPGGRASRFTGARCTRGVRGLAPVLVG